MADYTFWQNALAGTLGPIHDSEPQVGFYRRKIVSGRNSPWTPVAIWADESGNIQALQHATVIMGPRAVDPNEVWSWCANNPITEEAYRAVAEKNLPWPDNITTVKRKIA